jgi:hypothetical protein
MDLSELRVAEASFRENPDRCIFLPPGSSGTFYRKYEPIRLVRHLWAIDHGEPLSPEFILSSGTHDSKCQNPRHRTVKGPYPELVKRF